MAKRQQNFGSSPQEWDRPGGGVHGGYGTDGQINPGSAPKGPKNRGWEQRSFETHGGGGGGGGGGTSRWKDPNALAKRARLGNAVRGASLLIQLLNEYAADETSLEELKSLIGEDATAQAMKLQQMLRPREKTVKGRLHSLPKTGDLEQPISILPSRLVEAFDTAVPANPYTVPPLPEISDPALAAMPFIHRSYFANDHKKAVSCSYERLELLGDAYIEIIATRLLYPMYPKLPAGRLSSIREKLICNETLAAYSLAYKFGKFAKVPDTYLEEGTSRAKIWTKLLGDIFEAYVAAVIVSDQDNGFERAESWLRALWAPRLPDANVVAEPDKNAKQELQRRLGGVGVRIVYENYRDPEPYKGGMHWFIKCSLNGWGFENQLLGESSGRSKQGAELAAAEEAMGNPFTAQIQAIKTKFDEKVRIERAQAAAQETEAKEKDVTAKEQQDLEAD